MNFEKISFLSADSDDFSSALATLCEREREAAEEAINYYLDACEDFEFAFSFFDGALLVRVFDLGRYFFLFPTPLSETADIELAIEETVRYCILEELEPIFCGVTSEEIGIFLSIGYRHINVDADSPDSSEYRVSLKNELSFFDEVSDFTGERITLAMLSDSDAQAYEVLCADEKTNEFMGYSIREDYPDADETACLEIAAREFAYNSALTLAVRVGGQTVGDVALHNLDFKGGADVSVRILPEHRRKGYAKEALSLTLTLAEQIGLTRLYARVDNRNLPSLSLFEAEADYVDNQGDVTVFTYEII